MKMLPPSLAFGELKTPAEWVLDPRCKVDYYVLVNRVNRGWGPEAAMLLPSDMSVRTPVKAFGEKKKLVYWLADPRCAVPASVLLERLQSGEPLETALTRAEPGKPPEPFRMKPPPDPDSWSPKYAAFGESKTLSAWTRDPRCNRSRCSLENSLRNGVSLEVTFTFSGSERHARYWAFGELKELDKWLKDSRCSIPPTALKERLRTGERMESALSRPESEPLLDGPAYYGQGVHRADLTEAMSELEDQWGILKLTLFEETKTAKQWTFDERCEVSYSVLKTRMRQGWPEEPFILLRNQKQTPLSDPYSACTEEGLDLGDFATIRDAVQAILAKGERGTIYDRLKRREIAVPRTKPKKLHRTSLPVTAWGETKRTSQWARDPRCVVDAITLGVRLRSTQPAWTPEDALSTPAERIFLPNAMKLKSRLFTAFGETKTLYDWAKDPRCDVSYSSLAERVWRQLPLEQALALPLHSAFGERKSILAWSADPRCEISYSHLRKRLKSGEPMESAMKRRINRPSKIDR